MTNTTNNQHHYFATNALGWATAPTLEEAIEKLWHHSSSGVRKWLNNCHKDGSPGIHFFTCRVPLPAEAPYKIEWYVPQVEGLDECANMVLTYYTQKHLNWMRDPEDEIKKLKARIENMQEQLDRVTKDHLKAVNAE